MDRHHAGRRHGPGLGRVLVSTPVPPWQGYVEFVANPLPGGAAPPPAHLLQENGFDLQQEDGSLILI